MPSQTIRCRMKIWRLGEFWIYVAVSPIVNYAVSFTPISAADMRFDPASRICSTIRGCEVIRDGAGGKLLIVFCRRSSICNVLDSFRSILRAARASGYDQVTADCTVRCR